MPGMGDMIPEGEDPEVALKRIQGMIDSMTKEERRNPDIIDLSRRRRIAAGSGIEPHEIKQFLDQFDQVRDADEADGQDEHVGADQDGEHGQDGRVHARREIQDQGRHRPPQERQGTGRGAQEEEEARQEAEAVSGNVTDAIRTLLESAGVTYRTVEHPPTHTSEESAQARGEPLHIGGKAILLKTDDVFRLFVLPADRKLDSAAIKRELGVKKTRFATAEELMQLTGLVPGSVPPFGQPVLPFELFVDEAIQQNDRIAFNAGSLTISFVVPMADYLRVAQPRVFAFST